MAALSNTPSPWSQILGGPGRLTSVFGMRNDPFTGLPTHHDGLDIAAEPGTTVYPLREGRVTYSGWKGGYGQVVVVNVPFTGQTGTKPRPALVVSTDSFHQKLADVIVCPISSQPRHLRRPGAGDHPLEGWMAVGLKHPSTVRISNILAVEKRIIKRVLGVLRADDLARVETGLAQAFERFTPDLVIYVAGTDILSGDPLGLLDVSADDVVERDEMVFAAARERGVPVAMLLAGGYQEGNGALVARSIANLIEKGIVE